MNHIGKPVISFASHNDATPVFVPGEIVTDASGSKAYKYVRAEDANLVLGDVVELADTTGYEVTKDRSGGSSLGRFVAGVALGAITDGYYGFVQVRGVNTYVKTDGGVAAGDFLVPHATTDGASDTAVSSSTAVNTEAQVFGFALTTDTTTTTTNSTAMLTVAA